MLYYQRYNTICRCPCLIRFRNLLFPRDWCSITKRALFCIQRYWWNWHD